MFSYRLSEELKPIIENQRPKTEHTEAKAANNILLIEDHHEALKIWRKRGFKNFDLVHLDAHIDFEFYQAKPRERVAKEAKSLTELRRELERSILYERYERDFDKQTNIENYIYPAMVEGIIKDFYWVVPGEIKEFKNSIKIIKSMLKSFARQDGSRLCNRPHTSGRNFLSPYYIIKDGTISAEVFGRKFVICILEKLPFLKQRVLLDIDTDFLVVNSLLSSNHVAQIAQRVSWISPLRLAKILNKRIKRPKVITIAYSVNGGFTPIKYKHLGDELAYRLSLAKFEERFRKKSQAADYFGLFDSTGKREYYQKAIKLNPFYRAADNNYGWLYLYLGRLSKAKKEFEGIARVDPENPYPFVGLGNVALQKKDFKTAKMYFFRALKYKKFFSCKMSIEFLQGFPAAYLGLAQAEFGLMNLKKAEALFLHYQSLEPMRPQSRYFLGRIYERRRDFQKAIEYYQDAMRLGLNDIDIISRLLRTSGYIEKREDVIQYALMRYGEFKKGFLKTKRWSAKWKKAVEGFSKIEKKMLVLEKKLGNVL